MHSWYSSSRLQLRDVSKKSTKYVMKVNIVPDIVPFGIDRDGSLSSPDKFAPANIPVTPEKRTPNN